MEGAQTTESTSSLTWADHGRFMRDSREMCGRVLGRFVGSAREVKGDSWQMRELAHRRHGGRVGRRRRRVRAAAAEEHTADVFLGARRSASSCTGDGRGHRAAHARLGVRLGLRLGLRLGACLWWRHHECVAPRQLVRREPAARVPRREGVEREICRHRRRAQPTLAAAAPGTHTRTGVRSRVARHLLIVCAGARSAAICRHQTAIRRHQKATSGHQKAPRTRLLSSSLDRRPEGNQLAISSQARWQSPHLVELG